MSKLILMRTMKLMPRMVNHSRQDLVSHIAKRWRTNRCRPTGTNIPDKSWCFDIRNVSLEQGKPHHAEAIMSFLNSHFWPYEPSVTSLWVPLDSIYLKTLTYKYATSGHRMLALECHPEFSKPRLIGMSATTVICPWVADELDNWAGCTCCVSSSNRMHFCAHLIRKPNLFAKYNVPVILEVEVLAVAADWSGHGVGTLLLQNALDMACELRYPLVQVLCTSDYTAKICERVGMKKEWSMKYEEFVDENGRQVFLPRLPHLKTVIYVKTLDR